MSHTATVQKSNLRYAILVLGLMIAIVPALFGISSLYLGFGVFIGGMVAGFSNEIAHYLLHLKEGN